jgi:hypothetical protein
VRGERSPPARQRLLCGIGNYQGAHERPFRRRQSGLAKNCCCGGKLQRENTSSHAQATNRMLKGHRWGFRFWFYRKPLRLPIQNAMPSWTDAGSFDAFQPKRCGLISIIAIAADSLKLKKRC